MLLCLSPFRNTLVFCNCMEMTNQSCSLTYLFCHICTPAQSLRTVYSNMRDQQGYKESHKIHGCNNCSKYRLPVGLILTIALVEMGDSVQILLFLCQVEISRRVTLEELPPVLVLHLKRFVYEKTGGCQKLIKNIEYPVDLEISKGEFHEQSSRFVYCFGVAF